MSSIDRLSSKAMLIEFHWRGMTTIGESWHIVFNQGHRWRCNDDWFQITFFILFYDNKLICILLNNNCKSYNVVTVLLHEKNDHKLMTEYILHTIWHELTHYFANHIHYFYRGLNWWLRTSIIWEGRSVDLFHLTTSPQPNCGANILNYFFVS